MDISLDTWVRVVGLVASALNVWGFLVTSERQTKWIFASSSLVWGAQYHLLGSDSGTAIMLLCAIRQGVSVYSNRMSLKERSQWAWFFIAAAVLLTALTAQVWHYAIMGMIATIIGTWTFFMMSNRAIRQWTIVTNTLWAAHAYVFESWELLVCMVLLNLAAVIGLRRLSAQTSKQPAGASSVALPTVNS